MNLVDFYHENLDEHGYLAPDEAHGSPHHVFDNFGQSDSPLQIQTTRDDHSAGPDHDLSYEQGPQTIPVSNATLRRTECVDALFGSALEVCLLKHYVKRIAPFVRSSPGSQFDLS